MTLSSQEIIWSGYRGGYESASENLLKERVKVYVILNRCRAHVILYTND